MLSLIVAIGAQNIFVISQGLAKNHVAAVCTVCALSDAVFTAVGIFLIGGALKQDSLLTQILGIGGVIFLLCYAQARFLVPIRARILPRFKTLQIARWRPS